MEIIQVVDGRVRGHSRQNRITVALPSLRASNAYAKY